MHLIYWKQIITKKKNFIGSDCNEHFYNKKFDVVQKEYKVNKA